MTDHLSQSIRLPDGRILMDAEYGAPNGKAEHISTVINHSDEVILSLARNAD